MKKKKPHRWITLPLKHFKWPVCKRCGLILLNNELTTFIGQRVICYDGQNKRTRRLSQWQMADYADALVAVWDGESRGTVHMICRAKENGLKVYVVDKNGDMYV